MARSEPRIIRLGETGSTNADAMRLALRGEALPLWVEAQRQTEGKGRAGRVWVSERGNLHTSLAVQCHAPLARAGELALVAGVALVAAIRTASAALAANPRLRLKWPNDCLIGFSKVGGILVETTTTGGDGGFAAVLGFGVNVAAAPKNLDRDAAALGDFDPAMTVDRIAAALHHETEMALDIWNNGAGFDVIRTRWLDAAGPLGQKIAIQTLSGRREGTYQGLSETGALLARFAQEIQEIHFGDVSLVGGVGEGRRD